MSVFKDEEAVVIDEDPEVVAEREYALANGTVAPAANGVMPRTGRRSYSTSDGSKNPSSVAAPVMNGSSVVASKNAKNSRKSRAKTGRGEMKKGGGGGKFTWGRNGEIYDQLTLDEHDPNYDSAENDVVGAEMTELRYHAGVDALAGKIMPIAKDYLSSGDLRQTADALHSSRMNPDCRKEFILQLCHLAIDARDQEREMACVLVERLVHRAIISPTDVSRAMRLLFDRDLPSLAIDYPKVGEVVGTFLARFVADHALDEPVVEHWYLKSAADDSPYRTSLERCRSLLCQPNAMARLHDVWGVGGGQRPVRQLSYHMSLIIKEYLTNNDADEAARSLKHLQVPHFNHELVVQTSLMALESMHVGVVERLARLLDSLLNSGNLSSDCVETGMTRFYALLADLQIDLPPAYSLAERWVTLLHAKALVSQDIVDKLPKGRGRKRFMSEGDGGRLFVLDQEQ